MNRKEGINLIIIGHIDAGKSTTLGHLYYLTTKDLEWKARVQHDSMIRGRGYINFSLSGDTVLQGQRELFEPFQKAIETNNYSISFVNCNYRRYKYNLSRSKSYNFTNSNSLLDFNIIVTRNVGLLIVSAAMGEFEAGISLNGQTREESLFLSRQGISHLIICINKMDEQTTKYSQDRFLEIKEECSRLLTRNDSFKEENLIFVPISAWKGENLIESSPNIPWWNGPTLIEAIDSLPTISELDQPLRVCVTDSFKLSNVDRVILGTVISGQMNVGDEIIFAPSRAVTKVLSMEKDQIKLEKAMKGETIAFNVRIDEEIVIRRGTVAGSLRFEAPDEVNSFQAVIDVTNEMICITKGLTASFHCGYSAVECQFHKLISIINRSTKLPVVNNPVAVKFGDCAIVELIPSSSLVVETNSDFPFLGTFKIRNQNQIIAYGSVISIVKKNVSGFFTKPAFKPAI